MPIDKSLNNNINTDIDITKGVDSAPNANITQNFYSSDSISKKDQKHLTPLPPINPNFIGRTKELKAIEENLNSDNVVCVVNGIGGVGKSELSYAYLHQHKDEYKKIAFIEMTQESGTLEEVFKIKFQDELYLTAEDSFDTIIKRLQKFAPKNLLLFDNLLSNSDFEKIKSLNNNFDILITTREDIDTANILNLDVLVEDDARELFLHIYNTGENIDDILVYFDNHPLFIKLIAYSLDRKYIKLEHLRDDIKNNNISKIRSIDKKTFKFHLQKIFDKQFKNEEDDELKKLLKTLALLPAVEIELEMLEKILGDDRIEGKLQFLVNSGWLINKEKSYKLHQIIKSFILEEHSIAYEDINYILDNIGNYIGSEDSRHTINKLSHYILIIETFLSFFESHKDEHIANILDSNTLLYYTLGKYIYSLEMQQKSYEIRKILYGEGAVEMSANYTLLALIYNAQGEYKQSELFNLKALEISKEISGKKHPDTATSYNNLAENYRAQGQYQKAELFYLKALEIREKVLGEKDFEIATVYNNLATFYELQGEYEKAKHLYFKALEILEEVFGENHPNTATSYNNLAELYRVQGQYEKAELLYIKALEISEKVLGDRHPDTATSYNNLALNYSEQGQHQKAEKLYFKALEIREEILGEEHPDTASSYNNIALFYREKGQYKKAEVLYLKALEIREDRLGEKHPDTATSYNNLAVFYWQNRQYKKAEALYLKALEIREEVLGEKHIDIGESYFYLALFYKDRQLCMKAKELFEKCVEMVEQLEYFEIDLIDIKLLLKQVEDSIKKQKKAGFKKKGKYCINT